MPSELILFNEGLAHDARSGLMQPGFLQLCENLVFKREGEQELRDIFRVINTIPVGEPSAIHSIFRMRNAILEADDTRLQWRTSVAVGNFTDLAAAGLTNAIYSAREYKDFLHLCNGHDNLFFDANGRLIDAFVANPTVGTLAGAAGAAHAPGPDGHYMLYVSYLITWANGQQYETGLSDASADVDMTGADADKVISWTNIPISAYAAISGTEPIIHRKLYRGPGTGGTLADIYLVDTITDNTTTTYSDEFTDAELAANGASLVDDYDLPPTTPKFLEYHYSRLYMIDTINPNRLYYSEPPAGDTATENEILRPLAFVDNNWDDLRGAGFGRVDPQGLIAWGTYLYIPLKHTWIRKYGNTPSTWSYKKTWAIHGIAAPYTIAVCDQPAGILGLTAPMGDSPGIAVFNGSLSQIITKGKFQELFEDDLNHDYMHTCRGGYDGRYYHLLYPSGSKATSPTKHAAFDLTQFPKIRLAFWEDLASRSIYVNNQDDRIYIGGSDGVARQNTGTEEINIDVQTADRIGGDIKLSDKLKTLKKLKYNIDTGDVDVTMRIYLDGTLMTWPDDTTTYIISGTGDEVQYITMPKNADCYRYSIKLTATALTILKIYGPWEMIMEASPE